MQGAWKHDKEEKRNNIKSQLSQAPHDRNTMKIRTENRVETSQNRRKIMSGKPQGAKLLATIQKARQRQEKKNKTWGAQFLMVATTRRQRPKKSKKK